MTRIELTQGVYWVGVVDWNLRDFHGYTTPRGGTYNAYLIVDEKIALVDTVKSGFASEMISRIKEIVDPSKIDYVVSNHVEMDHSSSLPDIMKIAANAELLCTEKGKEGLLRYYRSNWNFRTVKTGDELKLGKKTLYFITAPMLHWPDSMFTYLKEDKILLSNDGFGQHLSSSFRFDEDVCSLLGYECDTVMDEAAKYYANILMPFGGVILKKIEEIQKLGIEIEMIASSHGMIWKNPGKIIDAYINWSKGVSKQKVLVIYDTMWNSTEIMAGEILRGVADSGIEVMLLHLRRNDWSEIVKEVLEARAILIGSPTLNNGIFPTVGGFLTYLLGLRPKNKIWATFGSYGWAGGAVRAVNDRLKSSGYEPAESLEVNFRPDDADMAKCYSLGQKIASLVRAG
ncbi:MAG: FprA family A-type flavoprotein [Candidatus Methanoperedens sp.]|nr:FprA family A-type flavoprotein [Candidatus Methanoperedens sp.]MCZ7361306.1 FprA family A-type flavoprotein [Candidatus Methanoperedens sp.]HLB70616.1 FprA family A-type flavoprotein [Candidatus Methanoperedens sp.]